MLKLLKTGKILYFFTSRKLKIDQLNPLFCKNLTPFNNKI